MSLNVWDRCVQGSRDAKAAEYNSEQTDCEMQKVDLQKKHEDTLSTAAQLENDLEQLRQIYKEKSEVKLMGLELMHWFTVKIIFEVLYNFRWTQIHILLIWKAPPREMKQEKKKNIHLKILYSLFAFD